MKKTILIGGSNAGRIVVDDGRVEYRFPLPSQAALAETLKREGQGRLRVTIFEERYIRRQFDGAAFYIWEYSDTRKPWELFSAQIEQHIKAVENLTELNNRQHIILRQTSDAICGKSTALCVGALEKLPELARELREQAANNIKEDA